MNKTETKIQVISPDGFPIDSEIYPNIPSALVGFWNWETRYKKQGYYSSREFGRINLVDLIDFCEFKQVDKQRKCA
jgi:hypothetical protein